MTTMNLMPQDIQLKKVQRKRLRYWTILLILAIIVPLVYAAYKYHNSRQDWANTNTIQQQCDQLQNEIEQLSTAQNLLQQWQGRIALGHRMIHYPDMVALLDQINQRTPELVYYNHLQCLDLDKNATAMLTQSLPKAAQMFNLKNKQNDEQSDQKDSDSTAEPSPNLTALLLRLEGATLNCDLIADLLNNLKRCPLLSQVKLCDTHRDRRQGQLMLFTIEALIIPQQGTQDGIDYVDMQEADNF